MQEIDELREKPFFSKIYYDETKAINTDQQHEIRAPIMEEHNEKERAEAEGPNEIEALITDEQNETRAPIMEERNEKERPEAEEPNETEALNTDDQNVTEPFITYETETLATDEQNGAKIPNLENLIETTELNSETHEAKIKWIERFRKDESFRSKIILWICLCFSSGVLGWIIGQMGPSLLDLKEITNSRLEEASFFLTSVFFGYLLGTIICGAIYEITNPFLLLFVGVSGLGLTSVVIPWCSMYWLMISMHLFKGLGFGVLDTAGNSVFMATFKDEKLIQSYLQTIHLMFAVDGFLSPIATAPFLMQEATERNHKNTSDHTFICLACNETDKNATTMLSSYNRTLMINQDIQLFELNSYGQIHFVENIQYTANITGGEFYRRPDSILYQAYLISTCLCFILAIPFFFMFLKTNRPVEHKSIIHNKRKPLPLRLQIGVLILMCLFLGVDNGMEDTFFGLFSSFMVLRLGWSKQKGSYAMSAYWASFTFGRLSSILIGGKFKLQKTLPYYVNTFILGMIGLFLSAIFKFEIGIWICFPLMGFAVSVFFPAVFIWMEQDFMTVAGKISSYLLVSAALGSMLNPIFIGYLMDNFDPMWFAYVALADAIVLWIMFWVTNRTAKYVFQNSDQYLPVVEDGPVPATTMDTLEQLTSALVCHGLDDP